MIMIYGYIKSKVMDKFIKISIWVYCEYIRKDNYTKK